MPSRTPAGPPVCPTIKNRRFPEITGEDNLTVFSYSGRVMSPEWRWQRRRADLRHFEIFRHGPVIIYTRLPAGGTCYPICMFPTNSECLIGISDVFSAFCLRVSVIFGSNPPFGSPFSSKVVVRGHCLVTLSLTIMKH